MPAGAHPSNAEPFGTPKRNPRRLCRAGSPIPRPTWIACGPPAGVAGNRGPEATPDTLPSNPAMVLLDKPCTNLDVTLRNQMRAEVQQILPAAGPLRYL